MTNGSESWCFLCQLSDGATATSAKVVGELEEFAQAWYGRVPMQSWMRNVQEFYNKKIRPHLPRNSVSGGLPYWGMHDIEKHFRDLATTDFQIWRRTVLMETNEMRELLVRSAIRTTKAKNKRSAAAAFDDGDDDDNGAAVDHSEDSVSTAGLKAYRDLVAFQKSVINLAAPGSGK